MNDTIAAPATAPGQAAVAIVRISGPLAERILGRLFRPRPRPKGQDLKPWRLHLGELVDGGGQTVDECLAVFMPAPASYTGEDVCELHLHGGRAVVARALELTLGCGARLAEPGEFTRRAYLAGKLDLAQAEAVLELVRADTEAAARLAAEQLTGTLSRRISELREGLAELSSLAEAAIDFPEDEVETPPPAEIAAALRDGPLKILDELLAASRAGRPFREGALVVICGRPNVGKSTLLNGLLGRQRALISPTPGTTRDFIEETLEIGGLAVRLVDTAGLREAAEGVEAQGVALAEDRLAAADLALVVLDGSEPARPEDAALGPKLARKDHLVVLNKADLPQRSSPAKAQSLFPEAAGLLAVSALRGDGLAELVERLAGLLAPQAMPEVAPNLRHQDSLAKARQAILRSLEAVEAGLPLEVYAAELRLALDAVGEICGQTATEEILERIFSRFCIGK